MNEFLNKKDAKDILDILLSTGADFAEVFMEKTNTLSIEAKKDEITKNATRLIKGAALRIIKDDVELNMSTTLYSLESLKASASELASSFKDKRVVSDISFKENKTSNVININIKAKDYPLNKKIETLLEINKGALTNDKVVQATSTLVEKAQDILVFASDNTYVTDSRSNIRYSSSVTAKDNDKLEVFHNSKGYNSGYESFSDFDAFSFGKNVADIASKLLTAETIKGGDIPVIIHNGFGGVILHEACGHSLEATSAAKGLSVFSGKLGEKIASDIVTAIDDGTHKNAWGSINYDDEGTPSKRKVLIEKGILKSYLVDKKNSKKMNHEITGSSRRESYKFQTTSRMTNTYFENGESTFEDIIKNTDFGLFAKSMGGGSVNPVTGEFNFSVTEGYLVEKGKITKLVKGSTLIGTGQDVLKRIDMIANNLEHAHGMCGSSSGSIPTNVGQPTIRLTHMTVGGKN